MTRIFPVDNIMEETILSFSPNKIATRPHLPALAPLTYYGDNNKIPPFLSLHLNDNIRRVRSILRSVSCVISLGLRWASCDTTWIVLGPTIT